MTNRCGFYSKLGYCEGVVEEFGGKVQELRGGSFLKTAYNYLTIKAIVNTSSRNGSLIMYFTCEILALKRWPIFK